MTRSEMRERMIASVMARRPDLDAAGVTAEAEILWRWIEAPIAPVQVPTPPLSSDDRQERLHARLLDAIDDYNRRRIRFSHSDLAQRFGVRVYWVRLALKKLTHRGLVVCEGERKAWRCWTTRSGVAA